MMATFEAQSDSGGCKFAFSDEFKAALDGAPDDTKRHLQTLASLLADAVVRARIGSAAFRSYEQVREEIDRHWEQPPKLVWRNGEGLPFEGPWDPWRA